MRGQRNTEVNSPGGEEKKGAQGRVRRRERERESRVKDGLLFLIVKNRKTNRGRASTLVTKRRFIKN